MPLTKPVKVQTFAKQLNYKLNDLQNDKKSQGASQLAFTVVRKTDGFPITFIFMFVLKSHDLCRVSVNLDLSVIVVHFI